ncbi:immunoglobulin-like domain-containing protein [Paenibacillus ginsengarvi]|nr:immunoglobulin-like domain-containing protein [Paenibacillus ginsengarvi]
MLDNEKGAIRMLDHLRRTAAIGVLLPLLLAGCGDVFSDTQSGEGGEKPETSSSHAPVSMGNMKSAPPPASAEPERDYHEFQRPSGKWLTGQGIGWTVSAGAKKPEDEVGILLRPAEPGKGKQLHSRTIRYKLTERDRQGEFVRTVAEETARFDPELGYSDFTRKLPDKEGTYYFLTAEIMNGTEVEDTVLSALEVPVQRVEAVLTLDRNVYAPDSDPVVTLHNQGPATLFFGLEYRLELKAANGWVPAPSGNNIAVASIGYQLAEGGEWEQSIRLAGMPPGDYRFGKSVEGVGTSIKKMLYVEFSVQK